MRRVDFRNVDRESRGRTVADATNEVAQVDVEAMAMNDAALADDLDQVRFRAHLIHTTAQEMDLDDFLKVADDVIVLPRPPGTEPLPGYGHAMLRLAKALTPVP